MDLRRRALGRGLGALIPTSLDSGEAEADHEVDVDLIDPSPFQPREVFSEERIKELSDSIRAKGMLQPVIVRRIDTRYQLIAGERRLRAARLAGHMRVPVVVKQIDDQEALEMALIENLQRENLNPVEEARAYKRLIDDFQLDHEEIARRIGKNRSTVTNTLRILHLPPRVQEQIKSGELTAGHARGILSLRTPESQVEAANEIATKRLSVRDTERMVRERNQRQEEIERRDVEDRLARALGTRVRLVAKKADEGRIEIEYYSAEQLNDLVSRLVMRNDAAAAF